MMKQTLLKTIVLGLMAMVGVNAWADGVSRINYWTISSDWSSTRTDGSTSYNKGVLTVNSGSDNDKRGDIKNTSNNGISIGANKVIFYEIECTASGASLNANDMKFGYTATISSFNETAVVNEQLKKSNYQTVNTTHTLVYFDLSSTNADVAYFSGDANNKFTTDQKIRTRRL